MQSKQVKPHRPVSKKPQILHVPGELSNKNEYVFSFFQDQSGNLVLPVWTSELLAKEGLSSERANYETIKIKINVLYRALAILVVEHFFKNDLHIYLYLNPAVSDRVMRPGSFRIEDLEKNKLKCFNCYQPLWSFVEPMLRSGEGGVTVGNLAFINLFWSNNPNYTFKKAIENAVSSASSLSQNRVQRITEGSYETHMRCGQCHHSWEAYVLEHEADFFSVSLPDICPRCGSCYISPDLFRQKEGSALHGLFGFLDRRSSCLAFHSLFTTIMLLGMLNYDPRCTALFLISIAFLPLTIAWVTRNI